MFAQTPVKTKVFFITLLLAAAGLVAADRMPREALVELAPQAGLPAARDGEVIAEPRECDVARGIDTACVF